MPSCKRCIIRAQDLFILMLQRTTLLEADMSLYRDSEIASTLRSSPFELFRLFLVEDVEIKMSSFFVGQFEGPA